VYVKLPKGWTAMEDPLDGAVEGEPLPWQVVFDRDGEPTADHFSADAPGEPVGRIVVDVIGPQYRDELSLTQLRALAVGADPLQLAQAEDPRIEILGSLADYEVDGNHGNRVRFSYTPAIGGPAVVMDQVAVTDAATTRVYVIQVRCEIECFETHIDEIEQIIDSFHIGAA
jgi:hypothetical protein